MPQELVEFHRECFLLVRFVLLYSVSFQGKNMLGAKKTTRVKVKQWLQSVDGTLRTSLCCLFCTPMTECPVEESLRIIPCPNDLQIDVSIDSILHFSGRHRAISEFTEAPKKNYR